MNVSEMDCFKIDTNGICLLCLTPANSQLKSFTPPQLNNSNIFKKLLRYINVKPNELFGSALETFQSIKIESGNDVNVQITACSSCSKLMEEFGRLYSSYVLIMVQMDDCVTSVANLIKTASERQENSQHYLGQMKPKDFGEMINLNFASNLRNVILAKCVKKLQLYNLDSQKFTSFSEVSETEGLTSQEDITHRNNTDAIPLQSRERSSKRVAIEKLLQGNQQSCKPNTQRRDHKKDERIKCKFCTTELCSVYSLNRHMKRKHHQTKHFSGQQHQQLECSTNLLQSPNRECETTQDVDLQGSQDFDLEGSQDVDLEGSQDVDNETTRSMENRSCVSLTFENIVCKEKITEQANDKEMAMQTRSSSQYKKGFAQHDENGKVYKKKHRSGKTKVGKTKRKTGTKHGLVLLMKKIQSRRLKINDKQSRTKFIQKSNTPAFNHLCSTCGKGFTKNYSLIKHLRLHTGEKPYVSLHCPDAFSRLEKLRKHEQKNHSGLSTSTGISKSKPINPQANATNIDDETRSKNLS